MKQATKSPDFRIILLNRLEVMGRSAYWLSVNQDAAHPATIREFMAGRRDTSTKVVAELLRVTGMEVVAKGG